VLLLTASLIAIGAPAAQPSLNLACPIGVRQQLEGLYRWQVQRMDQPDGPTMTLSSQRNRFTPELFNLLMKAGRLTPMKDGRHLDFDVFSNTQVRTFAAVVTGCSAVRGNSIQAAVEVVAGLRKPANGNPRHLVFELRRNSLGQWLIAEVTYRDEQMFQLRPLLETLLNQTP